MPPRCRTSIGVRLDDLPAPSAVSRRARTICALAGVLAAALIGLTHAAEARASDNYWACYVPNGMTYDAYVYNGCDYQDNGPDIPATPLPSYHVREPAEGLMACTHPAYFFWDFSQLSSNCPSTGFSFSPNGGNMYRLWDIRPRTLTASPAVVEVAAPAKKATDIAWTTPVADQIYVSDNGGADQLFATGGTGHKSFDVASGHTYVFTMYPGLIYKRHTSATLTVRGVPRTLSSISTGVARRPDGKIDVLARGTDGNADVATLAPSGRLMTPWSSLSRQVLGAPSGSWTPDGKTLDVFAVAPDHTIIRRRFDVGAGWGAWGAVAGTGAAYSTTVGVARSAGGISLFMRGSSGYAYSERITEAGILDGARWTQMSNQYVVGAPSASWSADGRTLNVFAVGADYAIYQRRQVNGTWGVWTQEPGKGGAYSETVGLLDRGDALNLFVRGSGGMAYLESLTSTGALTGAWRTFDLTVAGTPVATWNADKTICDVVAVGTDNRVYRRQGVRNAAWANWANSQVASATVGLAAAIGIPGVTSTESVLARSNNGGAYLESLTPAGALGAAWGTLDLPTTDGSPAGSWSPDGRTLDVVAVHRNGLVYRRQKVGGVWSPWTELSGAPPASVAATASVAGSATDVTIAFKGLDGWTYWKTFPRAGTATTGWAQVDRPLLGAPALSWSPDGTRLELEGIGTDHHIWRHEYRRATNSWTPWSEAPNNGAASTQTVGIAGSGDGVSMFVRGTSGTAWVQTITRDGATVKQWFNLDKQVLGAPSGAWSADGKTLDVVVVGTDYNAWRRQYVKATNTWGAWKPVPDGGSAPYFALPSAEPQTTDPALGSEDDPPPPAIDPLSHT
jgi:hypothetical protein